jgi:hypothetical protein
MTTMSSVMSAEQQVKAEFIDSTLRLRAYVVEASFPGAVKAWDAFTEACLNFGECELRMRRSERLQGLDLAAEEAARLAELAVANNERGLAALPSLRPFLTALAEQEHDERVLSEWRALSADVRAEWRDQVSQLDLEAFAAQTLVRMMDECCDTADRDGLRGLGDYLAAHVERLDQQRRSPDRGTRPASTDLVQFEDTAFPSVGPFPGWKVEGAAYVFGVTLAFVILLLSAGAPWWNFFLVALIACIFLLLVALGC